MNKIGDPERKLCSKAAHFLTRLRAFAICVVRIEAATGIAMWLEHCGGFFFCPFLVGREQLTRSDHAPQHEAGGHQGGAFTQACEIVSLAHSHVQVEVFLHRPHVALRAQ